MPWRSLRHSLLISYLLFGAVLFIFMIGLFRLGQARLSASLEGDLNSHLQWIRGELEENPGLLFHTAVADSFAKAISAVSGHRVSLIDEAGGVLADSHIPAIGLGETANHLHRPELEMARNRGWGVSQRFSHTLGRQMFYVAQRLKSGHYVRLANEQALLNSYRTYGVALLFAFPFAVLGISFLAGGWMNRRILVSLQGMVPPGNRKPLEPKSEEGFSETAFLGESWNLYARGLQRNHHDLELEKDNLLLILNQLHEGIVIVNNQGRIRVANPAFRHLLGLEAERSLHGKALHEQVQVKPLLDAVLRVRETGNPASVRFDKGPFSDHDISCHIRPLGPRDIGELLITLTDIGEFRNLDRMKTEFVANASHELKTPLSSIKGYSETLLDGALDNDRVRRSFVEKIHVNALRLEKLILNLLHLSQLEYSHVPLDPQELNLNDCLQAALHMHRHAQEEMEVSIDCRVPKNLRVCMEQHDLDLIINNLISNAIKYNERGGRVNITLTEKDGAVLVVEDTGKGMSSEILNRIFERFYRADAARPKFEGTGLGLSIVKHAAHRYGINVRAESTVGKGSRFLVEFPPDVLVSPKT